MRGFLLNFLLKRNKVNSKGSFRNCYRTSKKEDVI